MDNKEKFVINNTLKPKTELKIERRVLNFDQMNKTLGLDLKKTVKSKTEPMNNTPQKNDSSDSLSIISQVSGNIDDLKLRLKAFEDLDLKKEQEELINLGFSDEKILSGEYINEKYDAEVVIFGLKCNGLIVLTNYRMIILPINDKFLRCLKLKQSFCEIPYMCIEKLTRTLDKKQSPALALFEITTKDFRDIRLKFLMDEELTVKSQESIFSYLQASINPSFIEVYALQIAKFLKRFDDKYMGWELYNIEKEFKRQGVKIYDGEGETSQYQYRYLDNSQGRICSTYPSKLVVPMRILDDFLLKSASFRSKERLPVLSYSYQYQTMVGMPGKRIGVWRSSQCMPGFTANRSLEDESLIRAIGGEKEDGSCGMVKIFDARPYLNAVANKMNGKGYEDTTAYRNAEIKFLEIPNIHKVREGHRRVNSEKIEGGAWFECLARILAGAGAMCQSLKDGVNILVHCSDGWDRTSQLMGLVEIIMDPYFRTMEGFFVLIEKDWIAFGHQFAMRSGHAINSTEDQKSPIFLQFLDCVHQLCVQYPLSFEFTIKLLTDIANSLHSCYFGTFLTDSILERQKCKFHESTVSLWSFLLSNKEKYRNPHYKTHKELDHKEILPINSIKLIRFWKELFMQYSLEADDHYKIYEGTQTPEDNLLIEHQNLIRENAVLKKSTNELINELNDCKATLLKYEENCGRISKD